MSILLTLVTFLLFMMISYLRSSRRQPVQAPADARVHARRPQLVPEAGLAIPKSYAFHPGHTWAQMEDARHARIGLDSFGADLIGKIDRVDLAGLNRWVRQGQKVARVFSGDVEVDLVAPVEGVVTEVNARLREDPSLLNTDPYGEGWLLQVQSPDLGVNLKNLLQGNLVFAWMKNAIERTNAMTAGLAPAVAQDGGLPVHGLLTQMGPEVRREMTRELFLT